MKKYILAACFFLFTVFRTNAQVVSGVDYDQIKKDITEAGENNYQGLLKRITVADSSLTADNYKHLYFGQVFQSSYSPYSESTALNDIQTKIASNSLSEAQKLLAEYLAIHPVSLGGIYDKMVILSRQNTPAEMKRWVVIYKGLISAITSSGDGKTDKTAMVVANISDEYKVLPAFGVKSTGQALTTTQCDRQILAQPNQAGLQELYFNVSKAIAKGFH